MFYLCSTNYCNTEAEMEAKCDFGDLASFEKMSSREEGLTYYKQISAGHRLDLAKMVLVMVLLSATFARDLVNLVFVPGLP